MLALVLTTAACSVTTFTQRVSVGSSGVESNGYSAEPVLSADGNLVAFQSLATTLVTGDANGVWDVYVRDRAAGTTERVSVREYPLDGSLEFKGASELPAISSSGSLVAYVSGDVRLPYYPYRQVALNERSTGKDAEVSWQYPVPNPGGGGWNQGEGNNESLRPSVSADGLTVAYESIATDLVKSDKNGRQDIFVTTCSYYVSADCAGYHTERVSVGAAGAEANGDSDFPAISGDGRFVAFDSVATNLVVGDTNTGFDTFVRDRTAGTIERVDLTPSGGQATGATIFTMPAISADGRFVAFASDAPDLVANDTNGERDIFVRDRTSGTTERVSVDSSGAEANGASYTPAISADGRFVAFSSIASNLVTGDTNKASDVFVRDRRLGRTERVSLATDGSEGNKDSGGRLAISADGRVVAFISLASNLVPGDTNGTQDVFVHVASCGNGRVEHGEDCDGGSCCTASCQPIAAGTACDDGNKCTQSDTCDGAGTCVGANVVPCAAPDQCHQPGVCQPASGVCAYAPKPNGSACTDGSACTIADTCQGGTCAPGTPLVCPTPDQCHLPGTCDTVSGVCSNPPKPAGASCNDGNACTMGDRCLGGTCIGVTAVTCAAVDQCHVAATCDPMTGCSNTAKPDGTPCTDGNACTAGERCQAGACVGGTAITCPSPDQCHTATGCNPASGCAYRDKSCLDGDACTVDACSATAGCQHSAPIVGCVAPSSTEALVGGPDQRCDGGTQQGQTCVLDAGTVELRVPLAPTPAFATATYVNVTDLPVAGCTSWKLQGGASKIASCTAFRPTGALAGPVAITFGWTNTTAAPAGCQVAWPTGTDFREGTLVVYQNATQALTSQDCGSAEGKNCPASMHTYSCAPGMCSTATCDPNANDWTIIGVQQF